MNKLSPEVQPFASRKSELSVLDSCILVCPCDRTSARQIGVAGRAPQHSSACKQDESSTFGGQGWMQRLTFA